MLESNCYDILCKKRDFSPGLGVFAACSPHIIQTERLNRLVLHGER